MKKALIVGINNYPDAPLTGCINDATTFAEIIKADEDNTPSFDILLEKDVQTKSALMSLIVKLFEGSPDTALLYFSGHGHLNEIGGYLVTPDHEDFSVGVSMDEILKVANESGAKNKVIILDCCNSGAMGLPAITNHAYSHVAEGVTILAASRKEEAAIEINGHGVFTNLLLGALQGGAADLSGCITPGSVYAYIDQSLGEWDQRPIFITNISRFTLLRKVKPPIKTETLRKIVEYFPESNYEYDLDPTYEFDNETIAIPENVEIFKNLQKMVSVGLIIPIGEEHMYYAAQNSKSCKLTPLGAHYWRLVKDCRV
jgi:hypothetical protein